MARARNRKAITETPTPGFAIAIKPNTQLGLAMLIAETEHGKYEPLAVVASVEEAREIAASNFASRLKEIAMGCEDVTCAARYVIWAQGLGGDYRLLREHTIEGTDEKIDW